MRLQRRSMQPYAPDLRLEQPQPGQVRIYRGVLPANVSRCGNPEKLAMHPRPTRRFPLPPASHPAPEIVPAALQVFARSNRSPRRIPYSVSTLQPRDSQRERPPLCAKPPVRSTWREARCERSGSPRRKMLPSDSAAFRRAACHKSPEPGKSDRSFSEREPIAAGPLHELVLPCFP